MRLKALSYKKHPYRWPTIGRDISHIEDATMEDVKDFFYKFYRPNNAIMVIAGNVVYDDVKRLAEKWFGPIPTGPQYIRQLPKEPNQTGARSEHVESDVPLNAIYKAFHMPERQQQSAYYTADLLSDVLGRGNSSRLHKELVNKKRLFSNINAYISGSIDPGLLHINGKLNKGVSIEEADAGIQEVIQSVQEDTLQPEEVQKVKNQAEASIIFSELDLLNRAMNLAYAAQLGNPDLVNRESEIIQSVSGENIRETAQQILREENSNTLYYHAQGG